MMQEPFIAWTQTHYDFRANYLRLLKQGELLCTYDGVLQTELYTRYCREMFETHMTELRRLAPRANDVTLMDFLVRG